MYRGVKPDSAEEQIMEAAVYDGLRDVTVKSVPDAKIELPNDVIVKKSEPRTFAVPTCVCMKAARISSLEGYSVARTLATALSAIYLALQQRRDALED
jgi:hypothetical protein